MCFVALLSIGCVVLIVQSQWASDWRGYVLVPLLTEPVWYLEVLKAAGVWLKDIIISYFGIPEIKTREKVYFFFFLQKGTYRMRLPNVKIMCLQNHQYTF